MACWNIVIDSSLPLFKFKIYSSVINAIEQKHFGYGNGKNFFLKEKKGKNLFEKSSSSLFIHLLPSIRRFLIVVGKVWSMNSRFRLIKLYIDDDVGQSVKYDLRKRKEIRHVLISSFNKKRYKLLYIQTAESNPKLISKNPAALILIDCIWNCNNNKSIRLASKDSIQYAPFLFDTTPFPLIWCRYSCLMSWFCVKYKI